MIIIKFLCFVFMINIWCIFFKYCINLFSFFGVDGLIVFRYFIVVRFKMFWVVGEELLVVEVFVFFFCEDVVILEVFVRVVGEGFLVIEVFVFFFCEVVIILVVFVWVIGEGF